MYSFDMVCIGAGGGPAETDLSAYVPIPILVLQTLDGKIYSGRVG